jgi:hypothetical protein
MFKVGAFVKFIADLNPQGSPARLSLYNWLRGFSTPDQVFSAQLVDRFFCDALDYPHWISNRNQLSHEVRNLIMQFDRFFQTKFNLEEIMFPERMQIIEVEHDADAIDLISSSLRQVLNSEDKFRVLADGSKKFIAIILLKSGELKVHSFDRKFTIRKGLLQPLRFNVYVKYNHNLQLIEGHEQQIEIAPYVSARFTVTAGRLKGHALRGFMFQNLQVLDGEKLEELPKIHHPLLRLEQYFVNRSTDSMYQKHVQTALRALALAKIGDTQVIESLPRIYSQTRLMLEQIYNQDQQLEIILRDLQPYVSIQTKAHYASSPQ